VLPQGAARGGVKVGALATQTDVKTTWPDGSIRFAVVTARVGTSGSYGIVGYSASTGSFTPVWPSAATTLKIGGASYVAALPPFTGVDSWLSRGALVRESRVVVTPAAGSVRHPFLRVVYDVRSYAGGGHRVDVTVENCLDVAATINVMYDVTVTVDRSTWFARTGVDHRSFSRWRKVFLVGGLVESNVIPDFTPFYRVSVLPFDGFQRDLRHQRRQLRDHEAGCFDGPDE
jgi:hypothetical protein